MGKVNQVLIVDGEVVILQYKRIRVLEFICHLNAYKVVEMNEMACVKQKNLQDFHPLSQKRDVWVRSRVGVVFKTPGLQLSYQNLPL